MSNSCLLSGKTLIILFKNYYVSKLNGNSRLNVLVKFSKRPESPACEEDSVLNVLNVTAGITKRAQLSTALTTLLLSLLLGIKRSPDFLEPLRPGWKSCAKFCSPGSIMVFQDSMVQREMSCQRSHVALDLLSQISKFPLKLNCLEQAIA